MLYEVITVELLANALIPIVVVFAGIIILLNWLLENAFWPITINELGNVTAVKLFFQKALLSIFSYNFV